MSNLKNTLYILRRNIILALMILSLMSSLAYSAPNLPTTPTGGYLPGTELDPVCAPGDTNCYVQASVLPTGGTTGQVLTLNSSGGYVWTTPTSVPVSSVFGRTGTITAQSGDYTTDQVTEGSTNLYITPARVRNTILTGLSTTAGTPSATDDILTAIGKLTGANTAQDGSISTINSTLTTLSGSSHAAVTLGTANGLSLSGQQLSLGNASSTTTGALSSTDWNTFNNKENALSAGTTSQYYRGDKTWQTLDTAGVPENGNLYWTNTRFNTALSGKTTTDLAEGTNLYYTDTRARAALSATGPLQYDSSAGLFSISQSNATKDGFLSANDWNIFNSKTKIDGEMNYTGGYFVGRDTGTYSGYNLKTASGSTTVLSEPVTITFGDNSNGTMTSSNGTYNTLQELVDAINNAIVSAGNATVFEITSDSTGLITLYAPTGIKNGLQLSVRNDNTGDQYNTTNSGDPEGDGINGEIPYSVSINQGYKNIRVSTDIFKTATDKVFFYRSGSGTTLTGDYVGWSEPESIQWDNIPAFNSSITWKVHFNSLDTDGLGNTTTSVTTSTFATFADLITELNNQLATYGSSFRLVSAGNNRIFVTDLSGNVLPDGDPYFTTHSFASMELLIEDNAGSGHLVKGLGPKQLTVSGVTTGSTGGMYYGTLPSSGSSLKWYAENATAPTTAPVATGLGSIAIGDGAEALADEVFTWGYNASKGSSSTKTKPYSSIVMGNEAGLNSTDLTGVVFIGHNAGKNVSAIQSNFIGILAGSGATNASNSNFLGSNAGQGATDAFSSNFFGNSAGQGATSANHSNFFGQGTGSGATNASFSNFFGYYAGNGATYATYSVFIGIEAGSNVAQNTTHDMSTCQNTPECFNAIFIGYRAGYQATNATQSNFLGFQAGHSATDASGSNFFGINAGNGATTASNSNFFGNQAGQNASSAAFSNFFGQGAGNGATNASGSNFFGSSAGSSATSASGSNFFGFQAGYQATNASGSNFFGHRAGYQATNASASNFFGINAGNGATTASNSNFFGNQAGFGATSATYSNLFGRNTGRTFTGNNIGSNNIIIGTNISLPDATANAMNLGSVLYGTGFHSTTTGNPSITPVSTGRIGIGVVSPAAKLDVVDTTTTGAVARFENSTGNCTINPTSTALSCSSDQTLKKNIDDYGTALDKITALRPVRYNWITQTDDTTKTAGFIAQELQLQFPDLVTTDTSTGKLAVNYMGLTVPIVEAIKELNLKVDMTVLNTGNTGTTGFFDALKNWLGNTTNGLEKLFARRVQTDELCVGSVCVTQEQFLKMVQGAGTTTSGTNSTDSSTVSSGQSSSDQGAPQDTTSGVTTESGVDTTSVSTTTDTTTSENTQTPVSEVPVSTVENLVTVTDTVPTSTVTE